MLTLRSNLYRATLAPERGGLICALQFLHNGIWTDMLRADPGAEGMLNGLPVFGCFPMVPFANRLSAPWLPAGNSRHPMPVNWPPQRLAMHGTGFMQHWEVDDQGDEYAGLSTKISDLNGNAIGYARQKVRLDEFGLTAELAFTNGSTSWLLAGVGFHPWLSAPSKEKQTFVEFIATGRFEMAEDNLPRTHTALTDTSVHLDWRDAGLDTCFSGWNGVASLTRLDCDLAIDIRSDTPALHCFVAKEFDAICIEPVTHAPDAANNDLASAIAPMATLEHGKSLSAIMTVSGRSLTPRTTQRKGET